MSLLDAIEDLESSTEGSRDKILRAPFGYPGGKSRSIREILKHLPYTDYWIDVFGGSGAVTCARKPCRLEIFNDRYSGVVAFYRCIRNKQLMEQLCDLIDLTIHSREDFKWCHDTWENIDDPLERAFRWYYMWAYSFGQIGRNWARSLSTTGRLSGKIRNRIKDFPLIHDRFKNIQIDNLDFEQCLIDYDRPEAIFYLDPPYPETFPVFKEDMKQDDHYRMINRIFNLRGFVALSGYNNPIYNDHPWDNKHEWDSYVSLQSIGGKGNRKDHIHHLEERSHATECLWIKESNG